MNIVETSTMPEFVATAVQWISSTILTLQKDLKKEVVIGLSGGSTPGPVYAKLAAEKRIAWDRVRFFLVDERYVPANAPESNQAMIRTTLLTGAAAKARITFPDTSLPLPECIDAYDKALAEITPDIVVLGMGEDAHIASLFPPVGPEAYGPKRVIHTTTDVHAVHDRISVTFPVLLDASHRLFLISGEKKKALLKKMQETNEDVSLYPAQYLFDERTTWIVGP
jgi:6-phosphogluconolactonase